jgi:hypothetical protein
MNLKTIKGFFIFLILSSVVSFGCGHRRYHHGDCSEKKSSCCRSCCSSCCDSKKHDDKESCDLKEEKKEEKKEGVKN